MGRTECVSVASPQNRCLEAIEHVSRHPASVLEYEFGKGEAGDVKVSPQSPLGRHHYPECRRGESPEQARAKRLSLVLGIPTWTGRDLDRAGPAATSIELDRPQINSILATTMHFQHSYEDGSHNGATTSDTSLNFPCYPLLAHPQFGTGIIFCPPLFPHTSGHNTSAPLSTARSWNTAGSWKT